MGEGSGLNVAAGRRHRWVSDRVIGLLRSGNAGGGKDPDFWCASEDGEDGVIGHVPRNTQLRSDAFRGSCIVERRRRGDVDYAHIDHPPCAPR
jgi:hypothetical protein